MGLSSDRGAPAIFLDRDGVVVENRRDYIRKWEHVEFLPRSLEALRRLAEDDHKVFLVTNQSAVGRGLITRERADEINARIVAQLMRHGGKIDGVYMCPHAPQDGCDCRKPAPGLIRRAGQEHSLDLASSLLIGDAISDLQAGEAAGLERTWLVRTGRGEDQIEAAAPGMLNEVVVFRDLYEAIEAYLAGYRRDPATEAGERAGIETVETRRKQ